MEQHRDREDTSSEPGGTLFVLSAPSGAGKTTLCRELRRCFPDMRYSVSCTTRKPRRGEVNGVDYFFVGKDAFQREIALNRWAEWALVHGQYYGTSVETIDNAILQRKDVLLDIDVQGTRQILNRYPDAVTIFIMPPSMSVLKARLESRKTDDRDEIKRRLSEARREMAQKDLYRHVIVNNELSTAIESLVSIIEMYRSLKKTAS